MREAEGTAETLGARAPSGEGSGAMDEVEPRGLERWLPIRWEVAAYLLLLLLALVMRLWDLGSRAVHHDESLHAVYSWYIFQGQGYQHNPMMHGPFQFYGNDFVFFFIGASDFTARLMYTLFGTALVGLPWLLRGHLGRMGALVTALFLAFSPTLLYFSRFARNDILMAVWVLGIVICIWQFLREERSRYLYLLSALLALAFTTKETIYLTVLVFAAFLFLVALDRWLAGGRRWSAIGAPGALILVLGTLGLPQASALVSVVQGPLGLVLANHDPATGAVGLPQGGGITVAIGVTVAALALSAAIGLLWDWRRWLICAGIFYGIWVLLYSSVFTHPFGLVSGMWQGLGYWVAQQDVARGAQPWYYYFVTGWTYEFLPFLFALVGVVRYLRRGDLFSRFLIFWAIATFLLFTAAAEKMPWLLVHLTLPMILLSGRTLGDLIATVPWQKAVRSHALIGVALLPIFLVFAYRLLFFESDRSTIVTFFSLWGWLLLVFGLLAVMLYLVGRSGRREGAALLGVGLAMVLLVLGARAGWRAAYQNGDIPTEMLVYTQSSPDIARIARDVRRIAQSTGQGEELPITVDGDDGFAWPWVWYLRDFKHVAYSSYGTSPPSGPPESAVLMVNANNDARVQGTLNADFIRVQRFRHRWWFPEVETYRGETPKKFVTRLVDRDAWRKVMDYWLYRKLDTPLGSVDAYLYYASDLQLYIAERPS